MSAPHAVSDLEFNDDLQENHRKAIENATEDTEFNAWIDGEFREAQNGQTIETIDPAARVSITEVPRGDSEDIDLAVQAAREAFNREWKETTAKERAELLLEWTEKLRQHQDQLGLLESLDTGKPLEFAKLEVEGAIEFIEYYAQIARGHEGKQVPVGNDSLVYTSREPHGVCGQIIPWNFPLYLLAWKVGPALSAGNTVVLKPAELTPLTASYAAQLTEGILPDGVFNIVHGYGQEAGSALTQHEDVDKLAFTGEDVTGEGIMKAAAANVTPVTLELGGKSPLLVFPDADLDKAVEVAADGVFYNTGQACDAASRAIVHEDVKDEFIEKYIEAADGYTVGDPLRENTLMGPLAHEDQFEKVSKYIDIGQEQGATLVKGGSQPDDTELKDGWFIEPTIFDDVKNDMRIAQEEIFGPVQSVISFSDYDEAIEIANDVEYGLAGYVITESASLAHRAAGDIQAGLVAVNKYPGDDFGVPFGGYKRSGIGRECAKETLDHYTQTKAINMDLGEPEL